MVGAAITASVALVIYLLGSLVVSVWWASAVTKSLDHIKESLDNNLKELKTESEKRERATRELWSGMDQKIEQHRSLCPGAKN